MYEENDFEEVYNGDGREDLVDNDEISAEEEAFMKGYDEDLDHTNKQGLGDQAYEDAFEKKTRRSKRSKESFDEEELEAEVLMQ
ncbi:MAG: hypothetical protein KC535_02895 [Nanoarchaeota archaeon]|nr:hypothetical protein [Nanoarchaeota archaeon]